MREMKLFKGYHEDFGYSHEKVVAGFFESVQEVEDKLVDVELEDYRGYVNDMEFGHIREEYPGLIESTNNVEKLYEECCRIDIQTYWKIEEIPFSFDVLNEGYKVYSCIGKEVDDERDIQVCIAKDIESAKDTFAFMLNEDSPHMRNWIDDIAINMSGAEAAGFFHDENGYMFSDTEPEPRADLIAEYGEKIWGYIDEQFEKNVKCFFDKDDELCEIYLARARGKKVKFPEKMYLYWWKYHYLDDYDYVISEIKQPVKEAVFA